jgi:lipopolysaccharide export system protein LptA
MSLSVTRLRRWFAAGAVLTGLLVAGSYFYARWRAAGVLQHIPGKIGIEVQQSASGFSISKSEQGRTLFTARASKAVQFKAGGRAELHDVNITVYGRDASRFDQIYGASFEYDPHSGDITASGPVQIDLEANPQGLTAADQVPPRELKNPVHIRTSNLVFNQKTGNASASGKVEFAIANASGYATGIKYEAKSGVLTLEHDVRVSTAGADSTVLDAAHGTITKEPRRIVLEHARLARPAQTVESDEATIFLSDENVIRRILARGNVHAETAGRAPLAMRSEQADLLLTGARGELHQAVFSGNVKIDGKGKQPQSASAGRVTLNFKPHNLLDTVRAEENVHLLQMPAPDSPGSNPQRVEVSAAAIDFTVENGRHLATAVTSGAAQILVSPPHETLAAQFTRVTAGQFVAKFDDADRLRSLHGAPEAAITSISPGQSDRVSTSQTLDVLFQPEGGVQTILQDGSVHFRDGQREAWAEHARYAVSDQLLTLSGSPRVAQLGLSTTAKTITLSRSTGDAIAEGSVKSTYSDLKPQPGGALLASADPIHVTAQRMEAHRDPGTALYSGDARLWQGANIVQAASIEFDRTRRFLKAEASPRSRVTSTLVQTSPDGRTTIVSIVSDRLTYADYDRLAHFHGNVRLSAQDATVASDSLDAYLAAASSTAAGLAPTPGRLEKVIAQGGVLVRQPRREARGDRLTYTVSEEKYVMTGGSPSIFDAERGKITGDSLTFFRRGDRVLVEGSDSSPTVTRTRVAR